MNLKQLQSVKLLVFGPGFCGENSITLLRQNDGGTKKETFDLPVKWPCSAIVNEPELLPNCTFGNRNTFYDIKTILEAITGKKFIFDYKSRKSSEKKWYREDTQAADKAKEWIKKRRMQGLEPLQYSNLLP